MKQLTVVLRDLRAFAMGADPPPPRPKTWFGRMLLRIGPLLGFLFTVITFPYLLENTGVRAPWHLVLSVAVGAPLVVAFPRPLLAWRLAFVLALVTGPLVEVRENAPWPWMPTLFLQFPPLLLLVAMRHRRGVLLWVWLTAMAMSFVFVADDAVIGVVVIATAIILIGDQVRRRREVQQQLIEEEERSELEQARRAVAEERNRIARELHDVVAHHMSLIAVRAETAPYRIEGVPPAVAEEFAGIAESSREALTEMRRLLGVLRSESPPPVEPQPGLPELAGLVAAAREAGVEVALDDAGVPDVPPGIGLAAFRIVQEALSNARRHAAGAPVRIRLAVVDRVLVVEVHNGPGEPAADDGSGERHGLMGMRERALAVGGTLVAEPDEAGGFAVRAALPLEEAE